RTLHRDSRAATRQSPLSQGYTGLDPGPDGTDSVLNPSRKDVGRGCSRPDRGASRIDWNSSRRRAGTQMTTTEPLPTDLPCSRRTSPLTETEMRAALEAIQRIRVMARLMAYNGADGAVFADSLDAPEYLPPIVLPPA